MTEHADRVWETSTSTGTGAFTLDGAASINTKTFGSEFTAGQQFRYLIENLDNGQWEVGIGTLANATTLTRVTFEDSYTGNPVNFLAGTKQVRQTITAAELDEFASGSGDKFYPYEQMAPATTWSINHNLGKFPSVTVVDSAGTVVGGDVTYNDANNVTLTFTAAFSGKAYLN